MDIALSSIVLYLITDSQEKTRRNVEKDHYPLIFPILKALDQNLHSQGSIKPMNFGSFEFQVGKQALLTFDRSNFPVNK